DARASLAAGRCTGPCGDANALGWHVVDCALRRGVLLRLASWRRALVAGDLCGAHSSGGRSVQPVPRCTAPQSLRVPVCAAIWGALVAMAVAPVRPGLARPIAPERPRLRRSRPPSAELRRTGYIRRAGDRLVSRAAAQLWSLHRRPPALSLDLPRQR